VGRAPLSLAYPLLLARLLRLTSAVRLTAVWRPALVSLILFAGAVELRDRVGTPGWIPLVTLGSVTAVLALGVAYAAGLSASRRRRVRVRALRVVGRS
jgi:hypothetical protein